METKAQGQRCRCCYSDVATKRLLAVDKIDGAKTYADLMRDAFCITLSGASSESRICEVCVVRLRDAANFRRVVEETESKFDQLLYGFGNDLLSLKLEPLDEVAFDCADASDRDFSDEDDTPLNRITTKKSECSELLSNVQKALGIEDRVRSIFYNTQPRVNMQRILEVNKYLRSVMSEDDCELPVGEAERRPRQLLPLRVPKFKPLRKSIPKAVRVRLDADSAHIVGHGTLPVEKRAARRIIIRNAVAILLHTTACPFVYYQGNFKCFYCRQAFFDFNLLKTHTYEQHGNFKEELRKARSFRDMLMVDITDFKCRICGILFHDTEEAKGHLISQHGIDINLKHKDDIAAFKLGSGNFNCHLCGEQFHVFRNLSLHINKHYANYMCDVCGKPFISYEKYKNHEVTHTDGQYKCSKCDEIFKTVKAKAQHYVSAHRMMRYGCPMCSEKFEKYLERTVHMSNVHNVTYNFKCPHCAKEFFHKPHLRTHITNNHMPREKKVECHECGMRFTDNHALSRHAVSHTGEKLYSCRLCGKKYGRKHSLNEHMRAHAKVQARGRAVMGF